MKYIVIVSNDLAVVRYLSSMSDCFISNVAEQRRDTLGATRNPLSGQNAAVRAYAECPVAAAPAVCVDELRFRVRFHGGGAMMMSPLYTA